MHTGTMLFASWGNSQSLRAGMQKRMKRWRTAYVHLLSVNSGWKRSTASGMWSRVQRRTPRSAATRYGLFPCPLPCLKKRRNGRSWIPCLKSCITPYGLRDAGSGRTRSFRPEYGGDVLKRDLAYHQGTVWVYPLGAYYLAYLRINGYSEDAKQYVRAQLEVLHSALGKGASDSFRRFMTGWSRFPLKRMLRPGVERGRTSPRI